MQILFIHCSPRAQASESFRLAQAILGRLKQRYPEAVIVERDLATHAPHHVDETYANLLGGHAPMPDGTPATSTVSVSDRLIGELEAADCVVIATPMHNFTVPSSLKAWFDHVVRIHRTFRSTPQGKVGMLADRPVLIAISSGGVFSGSAARQPDFLTPWLRVALNTMGLHDLTFFSVEGAALGPQNLASAREQAERALADHFCSAI